MSQLLLSHVGALVLVLVLVHVHIRFFKQFVRTQIAIKTEIDKS
jgi:hypothetical protein